MHADRPVSETSMGRETSPGKPLSTQDDGTACARVSKRWKFRPGKAPTKDGVRALRHFMDHCLDSIRHGLFATNLIWLLRNSSRISGVDQERSVLVCFSMKSDKISTNVPDSLSHDPWDFEFRNGPVLNVAKLPHIWIATGERTASHA